MVHALDDIADDLSLEAQRKAIEAIRELAGSILDDMRESLTEHGLLTAYRPIHEIDVALHRVRRGVLEKKANTESWPFHWDGDSFSVEDADHGVFLSVDPADNWTISTNGTKDFLIADSGLSSLLAALNGVSIAEEVAKLSQWVDAKEAASA